MLDTGVLNLKKEATQMLGVNHYQMPMSVSPTNNDQALPCDSLNPHATSGFKYSESLPFKAGETEAQ